MLSLCQPCQSHLLSPCCTRQAGYKAQPSPALSAHVHTKGEQWREQWRSNGRSDGAQAFLPLTFPPGGWYHYTVWFYLNSNLQALGHTSGHQEKLQKNKTLSARDGLYMFPWHLGKRGGALKGPVMAPQTPHLLGKRTPSADPGGVSLSVTANMDTLRSRLLWSLQNNHRQVSWKP